jgi:uncharacterized protein (DUF952 family)
MILHITTHQDWETTLNKGEYRAPSLITDGFIHCSTLLQTVETANLFFKGQKGLILLCIDEKKLKAECRYEDPTGVNGIQHKPEWNKLFPHVYGPINNDAVIRVADFIPGDDGLFELPGGIGQ